MTQTESTEGTLRSESLGPIERGFMLVIGSLVGVLGLVMIAVPTAETVARRFFGTSVPNGAGIVQNLTLWLGFLGALLASGTNRHLALSTVEAIPEGWPRRLAATLTRATSAAVCALLAYGSWLVTANLRTTTREVLPGLPEWVSAAVMPAGFGFMSLLFIWHGGAKTRSWVDRGVAAAAVVLVVLLGQVAPGPVLVAVLGLGIAVSFLSGSPIFVAMAGTAMLLFWKDGVPISSVPSATFNLVKSSTLPAIPLLTIAGFVMAEGGAAKRLVTAYKGFFGWMPGGVAVMATFVSAIFTTFTGGSGVTILALGGLLLPMLLEEKYPEGFSTGLVTASGSLGLLFPPSLPVILYSVVAQVPMEHLFIGGLLPGMLMIAVVAGYGIFTGVKHKAPRQAFKAKTALQSLWQAKWDLGLPTLVVAAIASGYATMVEAAALACTYALIVEMAVFKSLRPKQLPDVLAKASTLVGSVLILLGVAMGLSAWLVDAEVATTMLEWMQAHVKSPWVFLLALNVGLLVLGSVLEIYAAIVVLAPLVAPIGAAYGIDPIHLGVVFLANLELGFLCPPMGLNLFLSASRFKKPLPYLYKQTLPFLIILAVGVLAITYLDVLTTGVVGLIKK